MDPSHVSYSQVYLPKHSIWIFLVLSLACFAGTIHFINKQNFVNRNWKTAEARIITNEIEKHKPTGKDSFARRYRAVFEFKGEDGISHTYKGDLNKNPWQMGQSETIKFNPQAPSDFVRGNKQLVVVAWLLGVFGGMGVLASIFVAMWGPFDKVTIKVDERRWVFKRGHYKNRTES